MQTVEDLLDEIARKGMALNNLFQRVDMQWQANLRTYRPQAPEARPRTSPYGFGSTPVLALRRAIDSVDPSDLASMPPGSDKLVPLKGKITIIRRNVASKDQAKPV